MTWKLDAILSKPWMPASQMMGFKRRREPFCDGKTFFDDAALKAALGGCAASLRGEEYYYQEMKAALLCTVHFCFRLPSSYCPLWETLPQRYRSCRMIRIAFPLQLWYMCNLLPILLNSMDTSLLFPLSLKDPLRNV